MNEQFNTLDLARAKIFLPLTLLGTIFCYTLLMYFYPVAKTTQILPATLLNSLIRVTLPLAVCGGILFAALAAKISFKSVFRRLNLRNFSLASAVKGLVAVIPLIGAVYLINITIFLLHQLINRKIDKQQIRSVITEASSLELVGVAVSVVILAPLFEEILFRRIIYSAIRGGLSYFLINKEQKIRFRRHCCAAAVISCSVIFALLHFDSLAAMPGIFVIGLFLQCIYLKYNSLYPAIILHAANNLISFAATLLLK